MKFSASVFSAVFLALVLLASPAFGAPRHGGDDDGGRGGDDDGDRDRDGDVRDLVQYTINRRSQCPAASLNIDITPPRLRSRR